MTYSHAEHGMPGVCPCCGREYDHKEIGTWEMFGGLQIQYVHGTDASAGTDGYVAVDTCQDSLNHLVPEASD